MLAAISEENTMQLARNSEIPEVILSFRSLAKGVSSPYQCRSWV